MFRSSLDFSLTSTNTITNFNHNSAMSLVKILTCHKEHILVSS